MQNKLIFDASGNHEMPFDGTGPHIKVGIYWSIDDVIVGNAVYLHEAEAYGDALQYGGHHGFWENLKPTTEAERKFKSHAYDYYPRGRMVFFRKRQTVRLYVDRCMDNDILNAALDFFEHQETQIEIETDDHYRCVGCNRHYLE
jgi:hypothetical protein